MKDWLEDNIKAVIIGVLTCTLLIWGIVFMLGRNKDDIKTQEGQIESVAYSDKIEKEEEFNYALVENNLQDVEDGVYIVGEYIKGASELGLPTYYYKTVEERYKKTLIDDEHLIVIKNGEKLKATNDSSLKGIKQIWNK